VETMCEGKVFAMSEDDGRRDCCRCELAPWVLWLTLSSLVVEFLDDIVALIRLIGK